MTVNDMPANTSLLAGASIAVVAWLPQLRDVMSILASLFAIVGICYSIAYYRANKKKR